MARDNLKIGIAQINPTLGDLGRNLNLTLESWKTLSNQCDLIVFPELALSGYPPEDLVLKPSFIDAIHDKIFELVEASKNIDAAALIGTPYRENGQLYNAALLIQNGEVLERVFKRYLPDYGVFDETRVFDAGLHSAALELNGHKLGVMICEDMWHPTPAADLRADDAQSLIVLNGSPFEVDKQDIRIKYAKQRVADTELPLIYVNQIGAQDELVFDGASFVMNASGEVTHQCAAFETDITPIVHTLSPYPDTDNAIYKACVLGIQDYIHKNGFPGIVLGLSGGLDSAIAAIMACDAVSAENVTCIMMPSRFTSQDSLDDAAALAQTLGCAYQVQPIDEALKTFESTVPQLEGIAHENIQSRIRGLMLMAHSNSSAQMVLTTGNKSEMAAGYATLYGDMCGGYNPLKDIYKSKLYEMAETLPQIKDIIPERIVTRPPSAELKADQTDQDSLPDYKILDAILECLIEDEMSLTDTAKKTSQDEALVLKIWHMLDRCEYKRYQAAPGAKVSRKSFGRDRRYPMTNGFAKNLKNA